MYSYHLPRYGCPIGFIELVPRFFNVITIGPIMIALIHNGRTVSSVYQYFSPLVLYTNSKIQFIGTAQLMFNIIFKVGWWLHIPCRPA